MSITYLIVLIAANALVSFKGFEDAAFFRKYEFHVGSIRAGEQYRMFSSAFLHVDFMHLALNMLALYLFGPVVIGYSGPFGFLLVYFVSLLFGSLLTMVFHKDDYSYRAVGASGATTGVLYASILFEPDMRINFIPAYLFGLIYLLFSIYGMKTKKDNIGHTAHFGGAIGGMLITLAAHPGLISDRPGIVLFLTVPIVILFIMAKLGKI
ncbi:MAG: rhomboid family intramembrane serine protease [Flavobacterium sp. BFFFF1]|uniref:rhomboid family intramembrane serine protease n=1 Tax=Flavobacterium sp. BFFFF1 TaxID=2015557 RepID=UPI000BCB7781|nr:rhomboid family intramembrane serine protease [Flavobacterium sp. BFFFF1]OYU81752.1 MAG: rhomboid family intramembrane serine protease [Flavobacterium sp. BFFFF1]